MRSVHAAVRLLSALAPPPWPPTRTVPRRDAKWSFAGRVQGVGFRYTTRQIAGRFDVYGFVQNLADGRVLLVAEGEPDVVDEFVGAVADEMDGCITSSQHSQQPATGEFERFEVRF